MLTGSADSLGLGSALQTQTAGETDEEKRKRKLGLGQPQSLTDLLGFAKPQGVAAGMLGLSAAGGQRGRGY